MICGDDTPDVHFAMNPEQLKDEFDRRLTEFGVAVADLTPALGVRLMLDFYRDVRVIGCEPVDDGDMFLFQWGVCDFGEGPSFQFDLSRQLMVTSEEGDAGDVVMSQLSLTFHYQPTPQLEAIRDGNRWSRTPKDLRAYETFINYSDAMLLIAKLRPRKVTLDYHEI